MPEHGGNATSSPSPRDGDSKDVGAKEGGPKTPTNTENGDKNMTQIELTPIESLLFFNMVRFNGVSISQIEILTPFNSSHLYPASQNFHLATNLETGHDQADAPFPPYLCRSTSLVLWLADF